MTHKFLGKEVELKEFNIATYRAIQSVMIGKSDVSNGEASVNMDSFNQAVDMTIENGTVSDDINAEYLGNLPAKHQAEVQSLYDAIQKLNGL